MKTFRTMSPERLDELIAAFPRLRIAVLGDFFLDKYFDVDPAAEEISVETGKTAHQVARVRHSPGAAGTVVCNLASLAARTLHAIGFSGDDGESYELRGDLDRLGCRTEHLHREPERVTPTYLKPRNQDDPSLDGEHQRYDIKNRTTTPATVQQKIIESLDVLLPQLDAVIVVDQVEQSDCGVITALVREALTDRARQHPHVVFWADSRRRIRQFQGLTIKPNQFEAVGRDEPMPGDSVDPAELLSAMQQLRDAHGAPICVTRGAQGMIVSDPEPTLVPGVRLDGPTDPTGAGDSATASAVLALAAGAELPEAALLGNLVASITVEQLAVTGTARPEQLPDRLRKWQSQQE